LTRKYLTLIFARKDYIAIFRRENVKSYEFLQNYTVDITRRGAID